MALNVGSLVAYLDLDDRTFTRKAAQADKKLDALRLHLEALAKSDPKIKVQVDAEMAKIDELKARIAHLKEESARGVNVRVDMVQAMVALDAIQAKVRSLHGKEIKVDVDTKAATQNVRALGVAIALLGPTIGPVAASATGMSVALGSVFAAGAVGVGLWAKAAQSAVKDTLKQQKALEAAQKKVAEAKTPTARASAAKELAELEALNRQQERFIKGQSQMKSAWMKLATSKSTFGPLVSGMTVLTAIIPKLKPLLDTVSKSLTGAIDGVGKWVDSGSFDRFIKGFSELAGPSISIGLRTLGNFAKGFGGMARAFGPLGLQLASGLERMSASFAKWGNNSAGLQQFVEYVSTEGPKILHLVGNVAEAIVHLGIATAPVGGVILTVLSGIAKGISMIPVPVLVPLASGLVAVNLALEALKVTTAAANALGMERTTMALSNMSKMKFAGVAMGLGAVTASATSSNKALSILGSAAGGALLGFQVGGPWGAAIGAGAGALFGLATASHKSKKAMDDEVPSADALAQSLRGVAGAATDAARAQEISAARKNGSLKTGQDIGLTPRQVADASLGNAGAQEAAARAVAARRARLQAQLAAAKAEFSRLMSSEDRSPEAVQNIYAADAAVQKATRSYKDGSKALDAFSKNLGNSAGEARSAREGIWLTQQVTATYAKNLKQLPPAVQTQIQLMNVAPTLGDIARIARQYKLTPEKIATLIKATGVEATVADVQRVIKKQNEIDRNIPVNVAFTVSGMSAVFRAHEQAQAMSRVNMTVANSGPRKANGGRISGPGSGTSDSIVAHVSNGEFIVNAAQTKRHLPLLAAINAGSFAKGGKVDAKGKKRRAAARAALAAIDTRISDAQGFGAAFAGNVFGQNFTGASGAMSSPYALGGSMVSTSTGPSSAGILGQMLAYLRDQDSQAAQLGNDINVLRNAGISQSLIAQMQSAGASGLSQIHALAGGSADQIREFNALASSAESRLNDAGAMGLSGQSMSSLQKQRLTQASIAKGIKDGIKDGVKVHVVGGGHHLRTNG